MKVKIHGEKKFLSFLPHTPFPSRSIHPGSGRSNEVTVTADKQSYEHKSKGSVFGSACVKRPLVEESDRAFKSVCLSATDWVEISGETTLSYTTCFLLGIPAF